LIKWLEREGVKIERRIEEEELERGKARAKELEGRLKPILEQLKV